MKPQQVFSRRRARRQHTPYTSFVEPLEERMMLAPLPTFTINDVSDNEGNTKNGKLQFVVTLSAPSAVDTQVDYTTANGTAIAGSDYTLKSGTLKFKAGETSKNIDVSTIFDTTIEPNETFFVNLTNAKSATIADAQGIGTIINDDGIPGISIDKDVKITEGPGVTALATVTLSATSKTTVTVKYATADEKAIAGLDYVAQSGTLTFAPGETSKTISITIINDNIDEDKQKFFIDLSSATNAYIQEPQSKVEITDDDPDQNIFVSDVFQNEGASGTTAFNFVVSMGGVSERNVKVDYATADGTALAGSDYTAATGTLTFAPGETTKTVTVLVNGDTTVEPHETFFLNLSNSKSATIADAQGVGTIVNDEGASQPFIGINGVSVNEGNSGTKAMTFVVNLSGPSASTVTVKYATADGTATSPTDYAAGSGTITFAPGETSKTITILANGDLIDEADETFFVNLTNPVGATIIDSQAIGTIANDDQASFSIDDVSVIEGNSGTTAAVFTVTLSNPADRTLDVDFKTKDATALSASDYQTTSGTLTFAAGETSKTITVLVNGDTTTESDETFKVSLAGASGGATISNKDGIGTILNDEGVIFPSLSIDNVSVTEGNSGTTPVTFTVSLSTASASTATVKYATADATATSPGDYASGSGTLTFAPGETSKTVTVQVVGDVLDESNETFVVNLSNAVGATISDNQGQATITDNDTASFSIDDVSVTEGNSGTVSATFTVSLSTAADHTVGVSYATANNTALSGSDYQTNSGTLSFAPGVTSQTITVLVNGDTVAEANETYFVNLSAATGGATITDSQGLGTIVNDDAISITVDDVTITEGNSGTSALTFTVSLSSAGVSTISVNYATANGTATSPGDYAAGSGTLTFAPGETSKTVTIQVVGDLLDESDETFFINLSGAVNAVIGDNQGLATITDNDTASFSIDNVSVNEGNSGTTSATFTVSMNLAADHTVGVSYATANGTATAGSDYQSKSGTLSFAPGVTSQTITVLVNGDAAFEGDETYFVDLSAPTGGATITDAQGLGTIVNDDPPPLSIDDASITEGNSGSASLTFTVTLAAASASTISVDYTTANGTATAPGDYTAGSGTLTFSPGQTSKTITVQVIGDLLDESDESFFVNLSNAVGTTIADAQGLATITDNDTTSFSIDNVTVTEGNSGTTSATFTVSMSLLADHTVGVSYATANGTALSSSDYQSASSSLSFTAGVTSQTVTVLVNGDTVYESDETFFVNLSAATGGATITDNQGLGTIVNDDPPPASINDVTITEGNSGTASLTFTVTLAGPSLLPATIDYATANGTATSPSDYIAGSGTLTFAPGETSKAITIQVVGDLLDESDETFVVNLSNPVGATLADAQGLGTITDNDTASFSIDNVSLNEGDSGTTSFTFTVSADLQADHTIGVSFATANGTGLAGSDYQAASGSLSFAPGVTAQTITVLVNGDTLYELNNTFFVNLTSPTGGATITDAQGLGTIVNDDPVPTLSIDDISVNEGDSGTTTATFTVTLSGASELPITVDYTTTDNTAGSPSDFAAKSGTLTFAPGETSKTITVQVNGDVLDESDEVFEVDLSNATVATIDDDQGEATIIDDDTASFSITDVSLVEGNSGTTAFTFTISLSTQSDHTVGVSYATADGSGLAGSDYTAASGNLSFAPLATSQTVTILVNGDTLFELDNTFFVNLSAATGGATITDAQGLGTIINDDAVPTLSINDVSVTEGTTVTFTITLSAISEPTINVDYATADNTTTAGLDYTAANGTISFTQGQTSKTVSIITNDDALDEDSPETFFLNLSNSPIATIADGQGLGSLADNDPTPTLVIGNVSKNEGDSGTTAFDFTVTMSAPSGRIVKVDYATANVTATTANNDYQATSGTLTFALGETAKTITVLVNGDTTVEPNETFRVLLSNGFNVNLDEPMATGTIVNDDVASNSLSISDTSVTEGANASFTVTLSKASASTVTVDYLTANGTATAPGDYTAGSGTVTFAPGETSKTISITTIDDTVDEANPETFFVNLSNPTNTVISDGQGIGSIQDNDPAPSISISDVSLAEGNSGTTAFNFIVSLNTASERIVKVNYATANGTAAAPSDYAAGSGTLTFSPGETNKSVTVLVTGDTNIESNETFVVNLTNPVLGQLADSQGVGTIVNDDGTAGPNITINDVTVTEGATASFTVTLSAASGSTVTVNFATANGTASAGSDYTAGSGTLTFAPGETSKTVSVATNNDALDEANPETFFVNLSSSTNGTITDNQGLGSINDNDPAPSISISDVSTVEGNSGTTAFNFTVTLNTASGRVVRVNYATANGTATAPSDYTIGSGTLTFNPGETSKTVTVLVNGDTTTESNETFFVNLTNPVLAQIADSQGVGTIVNDDGLLVPIATINDLTVTEGNSGTTSATFTVTLSATSATPITIDFATANGTATSPTDYTGATGTLTFAPGETSKTISVPVNGDVLDELNETFVVNLSNPVGATIGDAQGQATITDDDTASLSINDVAVTEGDSGTVSAIFTVTLSLSADHTVGATYTTGNNTAQSGSDYQFATGTVTFAAGVTSQTITVLVNGDTTFEPTETYFVNLSAPTGGAAIGDTQGLGTITNDDAAPLPSASIDDVTVTEGNSGTSAMTFTVSLSAGSASTITIDYATANGTATSPADYTAASGTLTFAPGETSKTVTVQIVGDLLDESNETFVVDLSNAVNATIGDGQGQGTINDNDTASISIDDVSVTEGNSGTVSATFTVSLSNAADHTVGVSYATANGTATSPGDYQAASGLLSFAPGVTTQTVTVLVNGDILAEPNETYFVNLSTPTGGAIIGDTQGLGTIVNDESAVGITIDDVTGTEGDSGTTAFTFTVTLSSPSASTITVSYASANGTASSASDYVAGSGTLTFDPGETSKTVTIQVNGDLLDESNETFFLNLSSPTGGATISDNQGLATITDDDTASFSINDVSISEGNSGTSSATFTVTLSTSADHTVGVSYATANNTATAGSDYQSSSGTLSFSAGVTSQTVTVLVNGDVVVEPTETYFVNLSAATGGATITDSQGLGTIGNDDTATLSIDDQTITEGDSGSASITFTVTMSNPSASSVTVDFATANGTATSPSDFVSNSGTLTFAPGETSKTITVQVNGDLLDESNETFVVNLSNPSGAAIADGQGLATINDNDTASFSIDDVSVTEGNSGTTSATFTVSLNTAADHTVEVSYATANGTATAPSDYQAASGLLSFAPGVTSQTITVLVNGDTTLEPDEGYLVNLSAPTGGATIGDGQGLGTILNDEPVPTLSINDISLNEGNSGTTSFSFTVSLSLPSATPVTVDFATANGTATSPADYTAASGTVTFNPGETSKTVTVLVNGDLIDESNETFVVNLSNPSGAVIGDNQGLATIVDDDTAGFSIDDVTVTEGNSGTVTATFTVSLNAAADHTVGVSYATADGTATIAGSDYQAASGVLSFAAGVTSQTVSVVVNGDLIAEGNETYFVNLSSATGGAAIVDGQGQGTINNDDPPFITIDDISLAEGQNFTTSFVFTVSLSVPSSFTVTVLYATANGTAIAPSDYQTTSGTLTFNPGETSKTITVQVVGEKSLEANETFFVNLSGAINAAISDSQGKATIVNDDIDALMAPTTTVTSSSSSTSNSPPTYNTEFNDAVDYLGGDKEFASNGSTVSANLGLSELGYYVLDDEELQSVGAADPGDEFAYSIDSALQL